MTDEDLGRLERELAALVPGEGADAFARQDANAFNAELGDVRDALLEPARDLLAKGSAAPELGECLERTVAQLAFWRRVLLRVHERAFDDAGPGEAYLVRYLLS